MVTEPDSPWFPAGFHLAGIPMPADFREMIEFETANAEAKGLTVLALTGRSGGWLVDPAAPRASFTHAELLRWEQQQRPLQPPQGPTEPSSASAGDSVPGLVAPGPDSYSQ